MIIGIDASNIRAGGGVTHLSRLLGAFTKTGYQQIERIIVWGGKYTLEQLPDKAEIELIHKPLLDKNLPVRMAWQRWLLPRCLKQKKCNVLFSPGGILPAGVSVPTVVMSQNMLPFESKEAARFPLFSFMRLKMKLLSRQQKRSMAQADGLVFLTRYAKEVVSAALQLDSLTAAVIPHGVEKRFFSAPRQKLRHSLDQSTQAVRILYVSIIDVYKHQDKVAEAVSVLRQKGWSLEVEFVGPAYPPALNKLRAVQERNDPDGEFLQYRGAVPFEELHCSYLAADCFVFASSCENLPNILLEAMAAGLPIACSKLGPMPEVLGDAGVYFDPESVADIEAAITTLLQSPAQAEKLAEAAFERAKGFSWENCAQETFSFIVKIALGTQKR